MKKVKLTIGIFVVLIAVVYSFAGTASANLGNCPLNTFWDGDRCILKSKTSNNYHTTSQVQKTNTIEFNDDFDDMSLQKEQVIKELEKIKNIFEENLAKFQKEKNKIKSKVENVKTKLSDTKNNFLKFIGEKWLWLKKATDGEKDRNESDKSVGGVRG